MFPPLKLWLCLAGLSLTAVANDVPAAKPPADKEPETEAPAAKAPPAPKGKAAANFNISMRDGLRFDPPRLEASPGSEVTITVENEDSTHQTHNFVVVNPGKLQEVVQLANELGQDGPAKDFVPVSPNVLASTKILDPDGVATIKFKLPAAPGIYPYVCTIPGHGMIMYGAIYSGVKPPPLAKDPNLPPTVIQSMVAGNGRRPFVQRMFMPDAGPAAIAVALAGTQNYCWDAGVCRLRYAWLGGFIDASSYWKGNGRSRAVLGGAPWWSAGEAELPLRFGSADAKPAPPAFLGYKLEAGIPEFHFRTGGLEVFEKIDASADGNALQLRYRILNNTGPVFYRTGPGHWSSSAGPISGNVLKLTPEQAANFTLTLRP